MDRDLPTRHYQILDSDDCHACESHYLNGADPGLAFSPIQATREQLRGMPSHFIVYAEHDCLRDHAHVYIGNLLQADVQVGAYLGSGAFHSFVCDLRPSIDHLADARSQSPAAQLAAGPRRDRRHHRRDARGHSVARRSHCTICTD